MKIEVKQVNKTFGKETVLSGVNLSIDSGKIFCLLGASGSGKTTLLQIIMGALPAESGRVLIGNTPVPNRELLSSIGYMPQNVGLYEELSIWDNLRFFSGIQGIRRKNFVETATELMGIVDLHEDRNKLVRDCSGGMKKRISLAVALIHKPSLLLLDEPTVGIDPILRKKIWEYLKELRSKGTTLIVTTHVMDEVTQCDDAGLLRNGRIIAAESVSSLIGRTPGGRIEEIFFMDESVNEEETSC